MPAQLSPMAAPPRWIVGMLTARQYYAIPRLFHAQRRLLRFYTDAWFPKGLPFAKRIGGAYGQLAARYHPELADAIVDDFSKRLILRESIFRHFGRRDFVSRKRFWYEQGQRFTRLICRDLERRPPDAERDMFFGFSSAGLEVYRALAERGVRSLHDEIAATDEFDRLLVEETQRFPDASVGSAAESAMTPDWARERTHEEWAAATVILVNSAFTKRVLERHGVAPNRIIVVPHAYTPTASPPARTARTGPLRVLFLGRASLMKGLPDFLEAARLLRDAAVFRVVGHVQVSDRFRESAPRNVEWIGRVPRSRIGEHYTWADVYVFPTICDGFGITQIEAMAWGLPVISTTNCGDVVEDAREGFRVPIRDPGAIADRLQRLSGDRSLLASMSEAAERKSRQFSLQAYYDTLLAELRRVGVVAEAKR